MDSAGGFHYLSIQPDPEFSHGFHLVVAGIAQQFRGEAPQFLLHSYHDGPSLFQVAGNVEQAKYKALILAANEVIKIAALPLSVIDRAQFSIANLRNLGVDRILPRQNLVGMSGRLHNRQDELSTEFATSQSRSAVARTRKYAPRSMRSTSRIPS